MKLSESLSFDVYNMHAKAGKWVFRAPECSLKRGVWNEWTTTVTVTREGEFNRSDLRDVDEIEIFKGSKNKLTMYQTYTKQFQCKYQLHRYPFDTQVGLLNI